MEAFKRQQAMAQAGRATLTQGKGGSLFCFHLFLYSPFCFLLFRLLFFLFIFLPFQFASAYSVFQHLFPALCFKPVIQKTGSRASQQLPAGVQTSLPCAKCYFSFFWFFLYYISFFGREFFFFFFFAFWGYCVFCIPDQAKRSRMEVGRHGMIFQHPAVTPLGSPGVPLQQLMPTAQGRSAVASRDRSALVTVIQCCWRSGFIPEFPKLIPPFFPSIIYQLWSTCWDSVQT